MVLRREQENRDLYRRWQEVQRNKEMSDNEDDYYGEFNDLKVRRRFIRRVFSIVSLQLMYTAFFIATCIFVDEVKYAILKYWFLWIIAMVLFLITYCSIICCEYARRQRPCNIICLIVLTLSLSFLTGAASILYKIETVLMTAVTTALVTLFIASVATCTKFDLTKRTGIVAIVGFVGTLAIIILGLTMVFTRIRILHVVIAIIGTLLISMYLFYDLQTIMGGRKIELSPDEVVFATTELYVDIIMLYRYLLVLWNFCGD